MQLALKETPRVLLLEEGDGGGRIEERERGGHGPVSTIIGERYPPKLSQGKRYRQRTTGIQPGC